MFDIEDMDAVLKDIASRNAGRPTLTIWKDGSYLIQGEKDAEIATRSEPEDVILNLDIETYRPVTFPDLQARTRLYEKMLRP